jgi:hypothetical protein
VGRLDGNLPVHRRGRRHEACDEHRRIRADHGLRPAKHETSAAREAIRENLFAAVAGALLVGAACASMKRR